jgi:hypothetical protein
MKNEHLLRFVPIYPESITNEGEFLIKLPAGSIFLGIQLKPAISLRAEYYELIVAYLESSLEEIQFKVEFISSRQKIDNLEAKKFLGIMHVTSPFRLTSYACFVSIA